MGTTYTCMDCGRREHVEDRGSYPEIYCRNCMGERPFIHPTDTHSPDQDLAAKYDYNPGSSH